MKVDSREPLRIVKWFRKKGWTVEHKKFADAGDIADDNLRIIIERKHRADIVTSAYDGRLISQCGRIYRICEANGSLGYLVVSGDLVESVEAHGKIIARALRKQGKRLPRGWRPNISIAQIYKTVSMIPWRYDMNVLWFTTEEEALEIIHYMLQEVTISDPFKEPRKRSRSKTKKKKAVSRRVQKRSSVPKKPPKGETEYEKYKRLGLI